MTYPVGRILQRSKLKEHLEAKANSNRFYPLCANCVNKVETVGGPRQRMSYSLSYKLSRERRSDDLAERRFSHGFTRASRKILAKNGQHFGKKFPSKQEPLANPCVNWLSMLY